MFDTIRQKLGRHNLKLTKSRGEKGQSLVEIAIFSPLIIFMLIGVFEVGWALRGYIVLANVNREITRFAVRPGYLDFAIKDVNTVGYHNVLTHTYTSVGGQLPLDYTSNSKLVISHLVIDTAWPCDPDNDIADCNCEDFTDPGTNFNQTQVFTMDDLILHPGEPGYDYYAYGSPPSAVDDTLIDYDSEVIKLARQNNKFNCELLKKGGIPSANNYVVTELFYQQPQLFGFPLVSNPLTDPVPLYAQTAMRIVSGSRTGTKADTVGPTCEAYPITFHEDIFPDPDDPPTPWEHEIDAFQGSGSGNFGWLTWNPDPSKNNAGYAAAELKNPRMAMHDFTDATDPSDDHLNLGDNVSSGPGVMNSNEIDDLLEGLQGKTIRVPIYSSGGGSGQNTYYTISHFAMITVKEVCLPRNSCPGVSGNDKRIKAIFERYQDDACPDIDASMPTPTPTPTNTPTPTSTPTNTPTATPDLSLPLMHVNAVDVTVEKSANDYRGVATVTVVDASGSPVQGVTVQGSWSGVTTGTDSQITNSSGQVTFISNWEVNQKGPYTLCVVNISKAGWAYNAGANSETCDSGSR